ncbi:unnamed protein product, partial [Pocillopora meandrina]
TSHKLVCWNCIIVGGIDGFSGLPVMLKCTDINNADTTLRCFLEAVNTYGPPSRVQTDQGLQEMKESFIGSMTSMWLFSTMFFCKKFLKSLTCGIGLGYSTDCAQLDHHLSECGWQVNCKLLWGLNFKVRPSVVMVLKVS